ncbi:uncharacterized protein VTP21DRAFT_7967 [Calcarisporiella thermophila]|uniref:uncharacterized protein n=1 Tax=Calcarisporiella thermophila TaxID=911321 RepID=UPI003743CB1D
MEDSPANAAHAFATAAEEYAEREQWSKAIEAHFRAAEQYLHAVNYTSDPEAVRTLKLLYANHTRQGKELQRRVSKRQPTSSTPTSTRSGGAYTPSNHLKPASAPSQYSALPALLSSPIPNRPLSAESEAERENEGGGSSRLGPGLYSGADKEGSVDRNSRSSHDAYPNASNSQEISESYMMLKGKTGKEEDNSDPFEKFWETVETLVQKLSNPVAFTTAPLLPEREPEALSNGEKSGLGINDRLDELTSKLLESYFFVPSGQQDPNAESNPPSLAASSKGGSRYYTPSQSIPFAPPTKTVEEYAIENQQLKLIIDRLSRRVLQLEKAAEEANLLRSSILQFRNDVQRQAKRIMQSQESMRSSAMAKNAASPENSAIANSQSLQKRVRELEEELRRMRMENEKQQVILTKYKERWDRLKESAKKRRSAAEQQQQQQQQDKIVGDQQ